MGDTAMKDRNIITTGFPIVYQKIHGLQMILPNANLSGTCLMDFQYTDDAQSMESSSNHAGSQTQIVQVISMITHSATQPRVEALACWIKPMAIHLKPVKQVMVMWAMLMLLQPNSLVFPSDSWVLNLETSADSHHECRFDSKYFKVI